MSSGQGIGFAIPKAININLEVDPPLMQVMFCGQIITPSTQILLARKSIHRDRGHVSGRIVTIFGDFREEIVGPPARVRSEPNQFGMAAAAVESRENNNFDSVRLSVRRVRRYLELLQNLLRGTGGAERGSHGAMSTVKST